MPPKPKVTPEMIVNAGFEIVRETGAESINARRVAEKLGCSTQPVMYHFKKIEDLKRAVYQKADAFHSDYITKFFSENPMLDIGVLYIRFAVMEKQLFRFLFQSNEFSGKSFTELIDAAEIHPMIAILEQSLQIAFEQAKSIFRLLFLVVQGYASLFANNAMAYDEDAVSADLMKIYKAAVIAAKEE